MEKTPSEAQIQELKAFCDEMLESLAEHRLPDTDASWEELASEVVEELGVVGLSWRWSDWGGIEFLYGAA